MDFGNPLNSTIPTAQSRPDATIISAATGAPRSAWNSSTSNSAMPPMPMLIAAIREGVSTSPRNTRDSSTTQSGMV